MKVEMVLAVVWFLGGLVFVLEDIGGAGAICSVMSMICGFMMARNIACVVQPNP